MEEAYGLSPSELCQKIKDFDALIIRSATQVRCDCADRVLVQQCLYCKPC